MTAKVAARGAEIARGNKGSSSQVKEVESERQALVLEHLS